MCTGGGCLQNGKGTPNRWWLRRHKGEPTVDAASLCSWPVLPEERDEKAITGPSLVCLLRVDEALATSRQPLSSLCDTLTCFYFEITFPERLFPLSLSLSLFLSFVFSGIKWRNVEISRISVFFVESWTEWREKFQGETFELFNVRTLSRQSTGVIVNYLRWRLIGVTKTVYNTFVAFFSNPVGTISLDRNYWKVINSSFVLSITGELQFHSTKFSTWVARHFCQDQLISNYEDIEVSVNSSSSIRLSKETRRTFVKTFENETYRVRRMKCRGNGCQWERRSNPVSKYRRGEWGRKRPVPWKLKTEHTLGPM